MATDALQCVVSQPYSVLVNAPGLSLTKNASATGFAQAGDVIPYSLVATNTGDVNLTAVSITDPLVPALTCTSTGVPATGQPVTLDPGETLTCTGSYTVTPADLAAGIVANAATVAGQTGGGLRVTADAMATVRGIAPGVSGTRLVLQACTVELQQDWVPRTTKLQFDVWNEDEVKFTGAFECADSWHETDFGAQFDQAQQNFTIAVLGTYSARYRVQAVTSTQCPGAQASGLVGVQSLILGPNAKAVGTTLAGAGKFTGTIKWEPAGGVPEGGIR